MVAQMNETKIIPRMTNMIISSGMFRISVGLLIPFFLKEEKILKKYEKGSEVCS